VLIEEVLERVPVTDWHDEWRSRVEEAIEMRDTLETVAKWLRECPGLDGKVLRQSRQGRTSEQKR
jgi:hypothetical protein